MCWPDVTYTIRRFRFQGSGDGCRGGEGDRLREGGDLVYVPFDFGKFLYQEPWNLKELCSVPYDIMELATERVYSLAEDDMIPDKVLQERLLREREESYYPNKWIRSIDAYRALCPEDPMGLEGMRHRAVDDAVMEGWVLDKLL